jgi:sugar-specific transcriptional regulator TrmB
MIQDDDICIQALVKLGLTFLQAKIYLTLTKIEKAGVKRLASASNVARPDVYRIVATLEKIGLLEKIITTPIMYKATPIQEGYYLLLQNKTQEFTEIQKNTMNIIKQSHKKDQKRSQEESPNQFLLISSYDLIVKKCAIEDSITKTSLDVIGEWKAVRTYIFNHIQIYENALKRGVKIRVITEKHKEAKSMKKILGPFKDNPLFEIRFISAPVPIKGAIFDGKKVSLSTRTQNESELTPNLWSENPVFLTIIMSY